MALQCVRHKAFHIGARNVLKRGTLQHINGLLSHTRSTTSAVHVDTVKSGESVLNDHGHPAIDLTFTNCKEAYRSKTTTELIRAYAVFQICSIPLIVNNNKIVSILKR